MVKTERNEKMMGKIKKLLAWSGSSNINEASSAAEKANKLLLKYNLSMSDLDKKDQKYLEEVVSSEPYLRIHQKFVLPIIQEFFFVKPMLFLRTIGFTKTGARKTNTDIKLIGTKENIEIAKYTYDFLCKTYKELWLIYKRANNLGENKRQHYYTG